MQPAVMPRRRLLLADENVDLVAALRQRLESAGYEVSVAFNGLDAIAQQERSPSEVLVVGLVMPECDGFEAIEAFRRRFPGTRIVAIAGGGKLRASIYLGAAALIGVDATLQKPFDADALLRTVRSLEADIVPATT
jgi:DNA-binding NtrC family response regulator